MIFELFFGSFDDMWWSLSSLTSPWFPEIFLFPSPLFLYFFSLFSGFLALGWIKIWRGWVVWCCCVIELLRSLIGLEWQHSITLLSIINALQALRFLGPFYHFWDDLISYFWSKNPAGGDGYGGLLVSRIIWRI